MAQNISLNEYAKLKESNINDIVQCALEKNIVIPNDPEYVLNDSILKQIDPIFHHKMRYGKIKPITEPTIGIKIIGKIDMDTHKNMGNLYESAKKSPISPNADVDAAKLEDFANKHLNERFCGRIERVMPHGAYISFEGIKGFLYAKDITWGYMDDIHNFLLEGEKIDIVVLGYDEKKKKLEVGRKQLMDDPLLQIAGSLSVGDEITGVDRKSVV